MPVSTNRAYSSSEQDASSDPVTIVGQGRFVVSAETPTGASGPAGNNGHSCSDASSGVVLGSSLEPIAESASGKAPETNDELASFLSLVDSDNEYLVVETLKESEYETTQKVMRATNLGKEEGPFVRKYLKCESGLGLVYRTLYQAQQAGCAFAFLPKIFSCYQLKNQLVVIMEYVQGETLASVLHRLGPSPELAVDVILRACSAVRELHEGFNRPIIHRDLKPSNIILSQERLALIDFGIARIYNENSETDTMRFGTRRYAPPEQFGFGQTDVRSDVYSLGMLLFYCLTARTANGKDRKLNFSNANVPEEFRKVVQKACAFDPDARYRTVAELQQAVSSANAAYARGRKGKLRSCEPCFAANLNNETLWVKIAALANKIPLGIGMAWNCVLAVVWLFFMAVSVGCCIAPLPDTPEAGHPLWFRFVEYPLFLGVSSTCILYELADRRLLRRRFPALCRWALWKEFLVVALGIPFALAVFMTFCAQFAA